MIQRQTAMRLLNWRPLIREKARQKQQQLLHHLHPLIPASSSILLLRPLFCSYCQSLSSARQRHPNSSVGGVDATSADANSAAKTATANANLDY